MTQAQHIIEASDILTFRIPMDNMTAGQVDQIEKKAANSIIAIYPKYDKQNLTVMMNSMNGKRMMNFIIAGLPKSKWNTAEKEIKALF